MGFEPTRAEPNGLAVHRLNLSATSSCEIVICLFLNHDLISSDVCKVSTTLPVYVMCVCISCRGRVVKAIDLKSIGIFPRRFEPCRQRPF